MVLHLKERKDSGMVVWFMVYLSILISFIYKYQTTALDIFFAVKACKGTDMKSLFFCDRISFTTIFLPGTIHMLKFLSLTAQTINEINFKITFLL